MADAKAKQIADALLARVAAIVAGGDYHLTPAETGSVPKWIEDVQKPGAILWPNPEMERRTDASRGPASRLAIVVYRFRLFATAGDFLNWCADVVRAVEAAPQNLGLADATGAYVERVDATGLRRVAAEEEVIGKDAQGDLEVTVYYRMDRQEL